MMMKARSLPSKVSIGVLLSKFIVYIYIGLIKSIIDKKSVKWWTKIYWVLFIHISSVYVLIIGALLSNSVLVRLLYSCFLIWKIGLVLEYDAFEVEMDWFSLGNMSSSWSTSICFLLRYFFMMLVMIFCEDVPWCCYFSLF